MPKRQGDATRTKQQRQQRKTPPFSGGKPQRGASSPSSHSARSHNRTQSRVSPKSSFDKLATKAGYEGVDDAHSLRTLTEMASHEVMGVINLFVSPSSSGTVTSEDMKNLSALASRLTGNNRKYTAVGGHVLPSEYFGYDSGNYHQSVPEGHQPWSEANLTRTPLYASSPPFHINMMAGGSMHSLEENFIERMVEEFNKKKTNNGKALKVSEDAMDKVTKVVEDTVVSALRKVKKDGKKKLTKDQIEKAKKMLKPAF